MKREKRGEYEGLKQTGTRGSVPTMQSSSHLSFSPRGGKKLLALEAKHDMRLAAIAKPLIWIP